MAQSLLSLHRVWALLEEPKVSEILGCLCHWRAQVVEQLTTSKQISLRLAVKVCELVLSTLADSLCEFRAHGWPWALRHG